jgi:hypothetical protein
MSDYVQTLREQLVQAAEREQRRRLHFTLPSLRPLLATAAVAAALVAAVVLVLGHSSPSVPPKPAAATADAPRPMFDGTLEGKVRYGTRNLVPPLSLVPDDGLWSASGTDSSASLLLQRERARQPLGGGVSAGPPPAGYIAIGTMPQFYDPSSRAKKLVSPPDLFAFLRSHPDIRAGVPYRTRIAGLDATALDFTYRFTRPSHAAANCRYTGVRCTEVGPADVHISGERARVYLVSAGGAPELIAIGGFDAQGWQDTLPHAELLLRTLELGG